MPEIIDQKNQRLKNRKLMLVRYGRLNQLAFFEHHEAQVPRTRTRVVVKTDKGLELGEVVGNLACYRGGRFRADPEQIDDYYKASEMECSCPIAGKVIRLATPDDVSEARHLRKEAREEVKGCQRIADEMRLRMKVVDAEHILGGERLIFYFMSETRVDFRDLVKRLSHEFQTRIEMRQIGARDEAKLLGDVESCGQEVCCRRFLRYLKPVNMRMAKTQKATLDPSKISGYCGRLKCCLRYEDALYADLKERLPKRNSRVQTPKGEGRVSDVQVLTQLVMVEYESGDREAFPVDEVTVLGQVQVKKKRPDEAGPKRPVPDQEPEDLEQ